MSTPASRRLTPAADPATVVSIHDFKPHCASCSLRELCLPVGLEPDDMRRFDQSVSKRTAIKRRDSLYRPGDPFTALYAIRLGTFKTLVLCEDGREQIIGYHMTGDVLGLDGIADARYVCQVIALEDSEVCVLPFDRLDALAVDVPLLRRNLFRLISKGVCRDHDMMLLLGSRCAEERLAYFLLNIADRHLWRGYSQREFILRMTREEIASYLGLKLETISRMFSQLQEEGLIQVQGRAVKLLDLPALRKLVGQCR